jgi:hypothetical protein
VIRDHFAEVAVLPGLGIFGAALVENLGVHIADRNDVLAQSIEGSRVGSAHAGESDHTNVHFSFAL